MQSYTINIYGRHYCLILKTIQLERLEYLSALKPSGKTSASSQKLCLKIALQIVDFS